MIAGLLAALVAAGCSGVANPASPPAGGDPGRYLPVLDQVGAPGFTVYEAIHAVGPGWLDSRSADAVRHAGFQRAAQVHFFRRQSAALATINGPVDVTATVAGISDGGGAASVARQLASALNGRPGATPVSTGSLGEGGYATTEVTTRNGVEIIRIALVWRVASLVNSLEVYGRYGGARLDDALIIAHAQTANEVSGGAPALPGATPSGEATPAPGR